MASEKRSGLGSVPSNLMRPTTQSEATVEEQGPDIDVLGDDSKVRLETPEVKAGRVRRKRPDPSEVTKGRKLVLSDDVYDRLTLMAFQRKTTASAIASEILSRNLPHFTLTRNN